MPTSMNVNHADFALEKFKAKVVSWRVNSGDLLRNLHRRAANRERLRISWMRASMELLRP